MWIWSIDQKKPAHQKISFKSFIYAEKRLIFCYCGCLHKWSRFHVSHKIKFQDLNPTPPKMKISKKLNDDDNNDVS